MSMNSPGNPLTQPTSARERIAPSLVVAYGIAIAGTSTVAFFLCLVLWLPWFVAAPVVTFFWGLGLIRGSLFAVRRAREVAGALAALILYGAYRVATAGNEQQAWDLILALTPAVAALLLIALPLWWLGKRPQQSLRDTEAGEQRNA